MLVGYSWFLKTPIILLYFHCWTSNFAAKRDDAMQMLVTTGTLVKQESVRPRWPYDMRPSVRAEKYIRDASGAKKTDNGTDGQTECDALCGPLLGRRPHNNHHQYTNTSFYTRHMACLLLTQHCQNTEDKPFISNTYNKELWLCSVCIFNTFDECPNYIDLVLIQSCCFE